MEYNIFWVEDTLMTFLFQLSNFLAHPICTTVQDKENAWAILVGDLVATNWPIEKALHKISCS